MRARFVLVPLLVGGIPTGIVAAAALGDVLYDRQARANEREYHRRMEPAMSVLRDLRVKGLEPCAAEEAFVCLRGNGDVRATAANVESALRRAGVTDVTSSCRDSRTRRLTFCSLRGRLHGSEVAGTVAPGVEVTLSAVPGY